MNTYDCCGPKLIEGIAQVESSNKEKVYATSHIPIKDKTGGVAVEAFKAHSDGDRKSQHAQSSRKAILSPKDVADALDLEYEHYKDFFGTESIHDISTPTNTKNKTTEVAVELIKPHSADKDHKNHSAQSSRPCLSPEDVADALDLDFGHFFGSYR